MILLILATHNQHKAVEIQQILGSDFRFLTLRDFPAAPPTIEDAPTFEGNASKKAVELSIWLTSMGDPILRLSQDEAAYVLADDSGLEVDALAGAPGVYSARFAHLESGTTGNASDAANNAKLLHLLRGIPVEKRTAHFRCVLALAPLVTRTPENASPVCDLSEQEARLEIFSGRCEGWIETAEQGSGGFGYDPLFIPAGYDCSFAQLGEKQKNKISHRAAALSQLKDRFRRT